MPYKLPYYVFRVNFHSGVVFRSPVLALLAGSQMYFSTLRPSLQTSEALSILAKP